MSYARARWYDARNAHWLSEDPLGAVDSTNLYAFVGWQPNMGTDPMGKLCVGRLKSTAVCQWITDKMTYFLVGDPMRDAEQKIFIRQRIRAFQQANGRAPAAEETVFEDLEHKRVLKGNGEWVDISGRIEADHAEWVVVGAGVSAVSAVSAVRAAGGSVLRQAVAGTGAVADELSGQVLGVNPSLVLRSGGRFVWRWGRAAIPEAEAELAYEVIRESTTDVSAISRYTGYKADRIERIKEYLFRNPGWDPDPEIAAAWHRLRTGAGTETDRLLLKHETAEMWVRENTDLVDYASSHEKANSHWNWQEAVEKEEGQ